LAAAAAAPTTAPPSDPNLTNSELKRRIFVLALPTTSVTIGSGGGGLGLLRRMTRTTRNAEVVVETEEASAKERGGCSWCKSGAAISGSAARTTGTAIWMRKRRSGTTTTAMMTKKRRWVGPHWATEPNRKKKEVVGGWPPPPPTAAEELDVGTSITKKSKKKKGKKEREAEAPQSQVSGTNANNGGGGGGGGGGDAGTAADVGTEPNEAADPDSAEGTAMQKQKTKKRRIKKRSRQKNIVKDRRDPSEKPIGSGVGDRPLTAETRAKLQKLHPATSTPERRQVQGHAVTKPTGDDPGAVNRDRGARDGPNDRPVLVAGSVRGVSWGGDLNGGGGTSDTRSPTLAGPASEVDAGTPVSVRGASEGAQPLDSERVKSKSNKRPKYKNLA
jgi:hypothetical protein